jgi:hypothetical protein
LEEFKLLNERNEISALLKGERINKKYTYRSCYLLAKHFKSLGLDNIQTRTEIFNWAKKYGIYISDDLNSIIQRAFSDKRDLAENIEIKINNSDIEEINKRFDKFNTKLTAFAMLCYAKKHTDKNGLFYISRIGLSNWLGIDQSNLSKRHIKELIDFGFLDKASDSELKFIKRKNKHISKILAYKIKIPIINTGDYLVPDYNIRKEFEEILANYEYYNCMANNNVTK